MVSSEQSLHILSHVPGRVRVHLTGWMGNDGEPIEKRILQIKGIQSVHANPRTGNVLIHFDRRIRAENRLLHELRMAWTSCLENQNMVPPSSTLRPPPSALLLVGVRGFLGHAIVDSIWFGAGFLGWSIGLPLAWLGPLHALMDLAVWTIAFRSVRSRNAAQVGPRSPVTSLAPRTPVDAESV